MDELKKCPICGGVMKIGGESLLSPEKRWDWYRSICVKCGWETRLCDTYDEVVEVSNHRPIEDELRAEIAIAHARITEITPANPGETLMDAVERLIVEFEILRDENAWKNKLTEWLILGKQKGGE